MEILKCIIFKLKFICAKTMHFAIRIHLKCHFRCSFFEISFTGTWSDFVNKNNDSTNDLSLRDANVVTLYDSYLQSYSTCMERKKLWKCAISQHYSKQNSTFLMSYHKVITNKIYNKVVHTFFIRIRQSFN